MSSEQPREEIGELKLPEKWDSKVPPQFLTGKSEDVVWLYNQVSINTQQNEFLIYQSRRDRRFSVNNQLDIFDLQQEVKALKAWRGDKDTLEKARLEKVSLFDKWRNLLIPSGIIVAWEVIKTFFHPKP